MFSAHNLLYDLDPYDPLTHTPLSRSVKVSFNGLISELDHLSNNTVPQITVTERAHSQPVSAVITPEPRPMADS